MYCSRCDCRFDGWTGRCPACGGQLVGRPEVPVQADAAPVEYGSLVELVRSSRGELTIPLSTVDVGVEQKWRFPYSGFGYAWAARMQGAERGVAVDLCVTEIGRKRSRRFPYFAYGYAWEREMQGFIGGNDVTLTARDVSTESTSGFPWLGRGYAWTNEWSGTCGPRLEVTMSATKIGRRRRHGFPYQGYGFAWADKAILTLRRVESA